MTIQAPPGSGAYRFAMQDMTESGEWQPFAFADSRAAIDEAYNVAIAQFPDSVFRVIDRETDQIINAH